MVNDVLNLIVLFFLFFNGLVLADANWRVKAAGIAFNNRTLISWDDNLVGALCIEFLASIFFYFGITGIFIVIRDNIEPIPMLVLYILSTGIVVVLFYLGVKQEIQE